MKTFTKTLSAAAFLTLATAAVPALAATDSSSSCSTLSQQVSIALSSASGDATEARNEQHAGMDACNKGFYAFGSNHYRKALSLLGK